MQKLLGSIAIVMVVGICSSFLWLKFSTCNNYENYARMAQDIVDLSISQDTESCRGR